MEPLGQRVAKGAERIPHQRDDPGAQQQRPLTEAGPVGAAALGVTARAGVEPQVVYADPVKLLVRLARSVLVQQLEGRRRVVVKNEQRVPAILSALRALAEDEGTDRLVDALDPGGRLGPVALLVLCPDVAPGLLVRREALARQSLPSIDVALATRRSDQEHDVARPIETNQVLVALRGAGIEDQSQRLELDEALQLAEHALGEVGERDVAP